MHFEKKFFYRPKLISYRERKQRSQKGVERPRKRRKRTKKALVASKKGRSRMERPMMAIEIIGHHGKKVGEAKDGWKGRGKRAERAKQKKGVRGEKGVEATEPDPNIYVLRLNDK